MFEFIHSKNDKEYADKLIKKYLTIDEENKKVKVALKYDKASDLLNTSVNNTPFLKEEVYERICNIIMMIPGGYKYDFTIIIDDYESYRPQELMSIIEDYFGIQYFENKKSLKRKRYAALSLLIAGIFFLCLSILAFSYKWLGENGKTILNEILDIVAWVFIWEAVTIYYLEGFKLKAKQKLIKNKINSITLSDNKKDKNITDYKNNIFKEEKNLIDIVKEKIEEKEE